MTGGRHGVGKPAVVMMVGIPGSGKSYLTNKYAEVSGAIIHSSDAVRKEIYGKEEIQGNPTEIFRIIQNRIKQDILEGKDVIFDACNIGYKKRIKFVKSISDLDVTKVCHLVVRSHEVCDLQNLNRSRVVPRNVMRNMVLNFWVPQYYEGWDRIYCTHSMDFEPICNLGCTDKFNGQRKIYEIPEINKHTLTAYDYIVNKIGINHATALPEAVIWQNVGKQFVDEEINNGMLNYKFAVANASAYIYMCKSRCTHINFEVARLIQWHEHKFKAEDSAGSNKLIKLIGENTYKDILIMKKANEWADRMIRGYTL